MTAAPSVPELDALAADAFVVAVAPLFEGAPRFLARLAAARPFGDAAGLFTRARTIAHAMPEPEQLELIDAHPRLGAPPGPSPPSRSSSRATTGLPPTRPPRRSAARVADALADLNAAYEARFGFRYCVFVAGRSRADLIPGLRTALEADRASEIARAIDAVVDIAMDRYAKLTAAAPEGVTR